MTASSRDDVLHIIDFVTHWGRLTARWQTILPQFFAGTDIVGADIIVERRSKECHAACGRQRTTEARHAHPDRNRKRRAVADRTVPMHPDDLHRSKIKPGHESPWGPFARQTDRREEWMQHHAIRRAVHRLHPDLAARWMRGVRRGRIVRAAWH